LENVQQQQQRAVYPGGAAAVTTPGVERSSSVFSRSRPVGRSQSVNWRCRPVPKGRLVELIAALHRQSSFSVKERKEEDTLDTVKAS
jgi:hypothetical protein